MENIPLHESDFLYMLIPSVALFVYFYRKEAHTEERLPWWQHEILYVIPVLIVAFVILLRMWRFGYFR